ncbi:hypothetical protein AX17_004962 [Amanita inopinata Kibby_2008]|nr:hypothetical protein AX17_004962 [Amanita inopinata Kibby_2008]
MGTDFATDIAPTIPQTSAELSYDDTVPYEEQLPAQSPAEDEGHGASAPSSLANRIGNTKVYLLSDASTAAARMGKRKHSDGGEEDAAGEVEDEMDMDKDPAYRRNAILLQGPPIAHLPTARLFEYAAHFDVHPLGLEWIDDITCIFVFKSKTAAGMAFRSLQRPMAGPSSSLEPGVRSMSAPTADFITARPIPISLWPPEERIHHSLGVGQGLRGILRMRWAKMNDVKKRGAKKDSQFYQKHGLDAGKESAGYGVAPGSTLSGSATLARRLAAAGMGVTLEERIEAGEEEMVEDRRGRTEESVREWDRGKPGARSASSSKRKRDIIEEEDEVIMFTHDVGQKKRKMKTRMRGRAREEEVEEFLDEDLDADEEIMEADVYGGGFGEEMENDDEDDVNRDRSRSPPSKMRSDYIADDGRTVIGAVNGARLVERIMAPLPRRARRDRGRDRGARAEGERLKERLWVEDDADEMSGTSGGEGRRQRGGRRQARNQGTDAVAGEPPRRKTRQELDEELDAFLNDRI